MTTSPVSPCTRGSTVSRVATTVRWDVVVPASVTATSVVGLRPCSTSDAAAFATSGAWHVRTSVPGAPASAPQSRVSSTRATVRGSPTGTPAYAGTATGAGRPG